VTRPVFTECPARPSVNSSAPRRRHQPLPTGHCVMRSGTVPAIGDRSGVGARGRSTWFGRRYRRPTCRSRSGVASWWNLCGCRPHRRGGWATGPRREGAHGLAPRAVHRLRRAPRDAGGQPLDVLEARNARRLLREEGLGFQRGVRGRPEGRGTATRPGTTAPRSRSRSGGPSGSCGSSKWLALPGLPGGLLPGGAFEPMGDLGGDGLGWDAGRCSPSRGSAARVR
jgi:hypothetical protein